MKKIRHWVSILHAWLGVGIGLLLIVISLSGAGIVFQKELDQTLNRSLFHVTPGTQSVSLDAMLTPVVAAHPELPIWFIEVPTESDQSYVINQKMAEDHRFQTFVNPYTGDVLGSRQWEHSLVGFLYTLHHDLFAGKVGQIIVGLTGGFLLLMTLSGIVLWTGWRRLINGFKIRWQAPTPLISYDLHKVAGIGSSVFLSIIAFTGIVIVAVHFLPMFNQMPAAKPVPSAAPVALSNLMQKADTAMPEGKTSLIEFPEHDAEKLVVRKRLPNQETGRFDLSTVELNRYSGEVIQASKVVKADPFFAFLVAIADLHFGTFGGLPTRILYVFIGLAPLLLFITGFVTWWHGKRRNPKSQSNPKLEARSLS